MPWRETAADLDRALNEQCLTVPGPHGDLYGIFTPAAPDVTPADLCVVLLSRPRFEYHRLTVEIARRLASCGFSCFRFDYHGWGDSDGELAPMELEKPFTGDVIAVIRYLREKLAQPRVVLWGRCFDALTALSVFADEGAAVDGLVFIAAPVARGLSFDEVFNWRNAFRMAASPQRWRSLIFSRLFRRRAIRGMRRVIRRSLGIKLADQTSSISVLFQENFEYLVRSKARAMFLYGSDDGEYQSFQLVMRHLLDKLPAQVRERFEVTVVAGRIHWITDVNAHLEVVGKSIAWIKRLHPAGALETALASDPEEKLGRRVSSNRGARAFGRMSESADEQYKASVG